MFQRIANSWRLVKASYNVLRADPELMLFPVLSTFGVIAVSIVFAIPMFIIGLPQQLAQEGGASEISAGSALVGLVLAFLFYFAMYTIIIFSNTALIGAAMIRLEGGDPTVQDGFRIASERLSAILGYAAIAATVGMVLNAIRNRDNWVAKLLASIVNMAWNLITFLVIPVLVYEKVGPIDAIKRSAALLKQTWGEQIAGSFSIGLIFGLITLAVLLLVGVPLIALAAATKSALVTGLAIVLAIALVMLVGLFGGALSSIFQAALYNYAARGQVGQFFDEELVRGAFHAR